MLSRDFPPFILNYPPPNPLHALGSLLKLNGLRGGERDILFSTFIKAA